MTARVLPWLLFAVVVTAGVIAAALTFVHCLPHTVDDSFITFRYARNLVETGRLSFNPGGPPAEGFTSPLWMLLCTIPHLLHIDPVPFSKVAGALALAGTMAATALVAWRLSDAAGPLRPLAAAAALFFLGLYPGSALHAASGMETAASALAIAVVALSAIELVRRPDRRRAAPGFAVACLFAALMRPEGNLFCALVALGLLPLLPRGQRRRFVTSVIALYIIPGALYFAARLAYFGLPFPLPFYLKVAAGSTESGWETTSAFFREQWLVSTVALVGIAVTWRRSLPLALGLVGMFAFFSRTHHIMGFEYRYLFPFVPVLVACATAAVSVRPPVIGIILVAAIAIPPLRLWHGRTARLQPYLAYARSLERAHIQFGKELAGAPLVVALADAGALPYYSRLKTIDTFGLNDPVVATTRPYPVEYVLGQRPDLIIVISSEADRFAPPVPHEHRLYDGALARGYRKTRTIEFAPNYFLWVLSRPG